MTGALLRAHDVWLEYPDGSRMVTALRGADIEISAGEAVGIMGPSGSGKSSLLLVLGGLRRPTRGHASLNGTEWPVNLGASADLRRRRIGFVFQEPFLIPYLTLRENARIQALDRAAVARIESHAASLGITSLLDVLPDRMSAGERQRGGILRALVNDPAVVIADEPTSNLDHANALNVMELLWECVGRAAVIVCSHDAQMLERADYVRILRDGVLEPAAGG